MKRHLFGPPSLDAVEIGRENSLEARLRDEAEADARIYAEKAAHENAERNRQLAERFGRVG